MVEFKTIITNVEALKMKRYSVWVTKKGKMFQGTTSCSGARMLEMKKQFESLPEKLGFKIKITELER